MFTTDSLGNLYFPAGISVASIPATTGTQSKVLVPGPGGRISSASISQLITQSGGNLVSSIFGRTGDVVAKEGDYTTDQVTEGQALYFSTSRARKVISLTTFNTSGPATYDSTTGILNIPQYGSGTSSPTNFVPLTRTITINGQTADLTTDRVFSVDAMVYPPIGIPLSNGTSWGTSITNNSENWNTAYGWGNHALAGYALDSQVVHNTGAETVAGLKTFTSAVKAPNFILSGGTGNTGLYFGHTDRVVLANYTVGGGIDFESNGGVINGTLFSSGNWGFSPSAVDDTINRVQVGGYVIATGYRIPSGTASQFLKADGSVSTLPIASATILGGIKVGDNLSIDANGVLSAGNSYVLPTASATVLGGIKVGTNLSIDANGVLSSTDTNTVTSIRRIDADGTTGGTTYRTGNITLRAGTNVSITETSAGVFQFVSSDTTYANFTRTVSGLVPNPGGSTTNRYLREDGTWVIPPDTDTNTWNANSKDVAGYVAAPGAVANKVWKTDASGNPAWRDDADTTYTLAGLGGLALSGGVMTGAITLKEGAANGLKFPNDVFGGSGDTAGMRLIARSGEAMSLEVYLTNDADDWFNISVPNADGAKVNGNTIWHAGNLTNLNQLTNGPGYLTSLSGAVLTTNNTSLNTDSRNTRGVTRLYRRDEDSDYSVQTHWTGSHWFIRGYNGDTFHAEARVGYSDSTGSVAWTNVSGRPSALSSFTNDLGNYGGWVVRTGDTMTGTLTVNTVATTNDVALFYSVEPHVDITAAGASNTAQLRLFPTNGYNALIGQFRTSGRLVLVAANTEAVYVDKSAVTIGTGSTLNSELILYSSNFGNGYATKLQGRNSDGKLWFQYRENSTTWSDVASIASAGITATAYFEFSDIRFKNVLETNPIINSDGIDVIKFTRKGDTQIRYGYSAQQVKKILPDAVEGVDKLVVNYIDVHTLKIATLEKRIAELEAKLSNNGL